jgi:hypothetical protein
MWVALALDWLLMVSGVAQKDTSDSRGVGGPCVPWISNASLITLSACLVHMCTRAVLIEVEARVTGALLSASTQLSTHGRACQT